MDQVLATAQPPAPPVPVPVPIIFQNARPQFRRMVFRGALLELVTVGFYRFWLATDIRRHMWRHTSVDGDALEYTGRAKELFFGALLALGIFAPLYLTYFIIGLEAERWKAFASVPFGLFFYLFAQFAIYRARRYRMTRTVWRGVRFWMTGSGWNHAFRSFGWMLLVILTFGLALPWREAALERYKMRHSYYGDLQGRFEGTGWEFFKRGLWLWLVSLLLAVFLWFVLALFVALAMQPAVVAAAKNIVAAYAVLFFAPCLTLIAAPFIYAAFKAIQWRWWISGIRFGDVAFTSKLRARDLFGLYWKVVGWLLLTFTLLGVAMAAVVTAAVFLGTADGDLKQRMVEAAQQWPVVIGTVVCYVFAALMATAVVRIYLIHDMTARIAASIVVHNIAAAENVAAAGAEAGALGEGLADSLDIFGF